MDGVARRDRVADPNSGDPRDFAPSMAVGFAINHIAAVVLPVLGGLVWLVDYRYVFIGGAALAFVSLIASQTIRTGAVKTG